MEDDDEGPGVMTPIVIGCLIMFTIYAWIAVYFFYKRSQ